jgi:serine/threonine protein kinase
MNNYTLTENYLIKDRYQILNVIGQGGFGITYEAFDKTLQTKVCIKELYISGSSVRNGDSSVLSQGLNELAFDDFKKRFHDEAVQIAKFNHKNIVKVIDVFDLNNTVYMVMEFLEGLTLKRYVEENGPLSTLDASMYIKQIFDAVEKVHSYSFLHRDIKPDNIIITNDNRAVLIDFGSARAYSEDRTINQTAIVSPGYAPIEQYNPSSKKGPYTDIYGLGATFYFMLTGVKPLNVTERHVTRMPEPHEINQNVTTQTSSAIMLALSMKAEDRFQAVSDFRDVINGKYSVPKPTATNDSREIEIIEENDDSKYTSKKLNKKYLMYGGIALLIGVLIIFSYLIFGTGNEKAPKYSLIPVSDGTNWQFVDRQGKIKINPQFNYAYFFQNGLSKVSVLDKSNKADTTLIDEAEYYKFIKEDGTDLNGVKYKYSTEFRENLAWVVRENQVPELINTKGEVIFTFKKANEVCNFTEGLALFNTLNDSGQVRFGYVNKKGEEIIKPQFYFASGFSDGMAIVSDKNDKYGYIDKKGKVVINYQFDKILSFNNGYAAVKNSKDKWGTIDKKGKFVINPQFDFMDYDNDRYIIGNNKKFGWCDTKGKIIINPQFEEVKCFAGNKLAPVKQDGKWGFVDREGKIVINPQFEYVTSFNHSIALAYSDEQWGIIDEEGKYIANPQFKSFDFRSAEVLFSNYLPFSYVESDFFDVEALTKAINLDNPEGFISSNTNYNDILSHYGLSKENIGNNSFQNIISDKKLSNFASYSLGLNGYPYESRYERVEVTNYFFGIPYSEYRNVYNSYFNGDIKPENYLFTIDLSRSASGKANVLFDKLQEKILKKFSVDYVYGDYNKKYRGNNFDIEMRKEGENRIRLFFINK